MQQQQQRRPRWTIEQEKLERAIKELASATKNRERAGSCSSCATG
jgi:hypothetical protein